MIIVGLGNPGASYEHNRHNVGFHFIDYLAETLSHKSKWNTDPHRQCTYTQLDTDGTPLTLIKPLLYMNLSGQAVHSLLHYLHHDPASYADLVIVHDDLDLTVGSGKFSWGKGPKGHNGIISLEQHLKTPLFYRLRIGVDNRSVTGPVSGEAYVLSDFTPDELSQVQSTFSPLWQQVRQHMSLG